MKMTEKEFLIQYQDSDLEPIILAEIADEKIKQDCVLVDAARELLHAEDQFLKEMEEAVDYYSVKL